MTDMHPDPDKTGTVDHAARFLEVMRAMPPESRRAFLRIYRLAPARADRRRRVSRGVHVRMAMQAALLDPHLAYWVRVNLAYRVALKLASGAGLSERVRRFEALLEDFHIAADAYVLSLPIATARYKRELRQKAPETGRERPVMADDGMLSDEEIAVFTAFKQHVIPGLVKGIRLHAKNTATHATP